MKTIFDVYVPMEDQEQCLRMKQVCIDAGLPIWETKFAFDFLHKKEVFGFSKKHFFVFDILFCYKKLTQVTEPEFLTLLNEWKKENNLNPKTNGK